MAARYNKDAAAFDTGGTTQLEILHCDSSGDLGYWVGYQVADVRMKGKPEPITIKKDVHTRAAEEQLRVSLGTPVAIKRKGKGGTIAITFTSENELQRLYEYLTEKR